MREFDIARARYILRELEQTTQGGSPMLRLECDVPSLPAIHGVGNRAGLFRLGVRIASLALTAESGVDLYYDGPFDAAASGKEHALVEFSLDDEVRRVTLPRLHRWKRPHATRASVFRDVVMLFIITMFAVMALAGLFMLCSSWLR